MHALMGICSSAPLSPWEKYGADEFSRVVGQSVNRGKSADKRFEPRVEKEMARKARTELAGAIYHLLDRGDRQEAILTDDADRKRFLLTLGQVCARTGWRGYAFVSLSDHYHLRVETPEPKL